MTEDTIIIQGDFGEKVVSKDAYINAAYRGLKESFPSVTREEIRKQLDLLLSGKEWTNVIGCAIKDDVVLNNEQP